MSEIKNINFHDSDIRDVESKGKSLTLIININTHWFPGKPFGILKFIKPQGHEQFVKFWQEKIFLTKDHRYIWPIGKDAYSGEINDLEIRKIKNKYSVTIELIDTFKFDFHCDKFEFKRMNSYKNFFNIFK